MEKIKTKLTIDAFRATQSMLPPIPSLRIIPIDEDSPTQKSTDLPEDPPITPHSELIISEMVEQVIANLKKPPPDKGLKISSEPSSPKRTFRKFEGWSKEKIDQVLEESIRIQSLKYNLNPLLGISPLFQEGIIHDLDIVPFMYFKLPT